MNSEPLEQLARSVYYSPLPALTVDTENRVLDYNLAMEVLAGGELKGHRRKTLDGLLQRLTRRVTQGVLLPNDQDPEGNVGCTFNAESLGPVSLAGTELFCRGASTENSAGRIIMWKVIMPAGNVQFHERFRASLDHELTWDTYAWSYDPVLTLMPYYQEVVGRHLEALTAADEGPVIDLGTGTGNLVECLILADRTVTAVDSSRAMLDRLRSKPKLAAEIGKRLTVIEESAESLPMIEDASFAGVSILLALFDMKDSESALATAVRILRPGGRIVITELKRCFQLGPILEACERELRNLGRYEELRDDLERVVQSNHKLAPGSRCPFRVEDAFDALALQGFSELTLKDSHFGQCATVLGTKPGAAPSRL